MAYYPRRLPPTTCGKCPPCCPPGAEGQSSSSGNAGTYSGNSVLLSSGQFSFSRPLLSIDSIGGISWAFGLNYLPGNGVDGLLGIGFNLPQNLHLEELANGDVELVTGDNTAELFVEVSPGVYEPAATNNARATLTRAGTGVNDEFTLTSTAATATKFFGFDPAINTPGRVKSVTDRFGNEQTYVWSNVSGMVQLASVTDSYGRTIEYRYYGSEFGFRLREIEDFLGRKLNFQFDALGHLIAVVTPSILRAAEGNTFPGGTAYVFQYDVNNVRPERRDDLIRIWYPNQVAPHLDTATRTVNVAAAYASATPRYFVEYGQDPTDEDLFGRVLFETVGNPSGGVGGTYEYLYTTDGLPPNLIDPADPIVFRAIVTDRNGNQVVNDFNANDMLVRKEVVRSRQKINIPSFAAFPSYVTWTKFNANNQPVLIVMPEGNSIEYAYEDGQVTGIGDYPRRIGLLLRETHKPGNTIGIPSRPGSNGQTELTRRYFYDPLFNQQTAVIERRGNPVDGSGTYFTPQNGGTTPTNADRSRYATVTYFDYQKDTTATVTGDANLQALLGLNATQIGQLITFVDTQMKATDGTGGLPAGFEMSLGDLNGDGTGDGAGSGLPAANHVGNAVKTKHPSVRLIGPTTITTQVREEIFTTNLRGQITTQTDPEGNLTIYVRYPDSDPEGDGAFIAPGLSNKQYGRTKEVHVDADPNDVLSLVGAAGDLVDFVAGKIPRTNTPGVYQNLTTRYEGSSTGGCSSCAYDPLGNPLATTDPRGFTSRFDRNELGEAFRTISSVPYEFKIETCFDANRNVVRVDAEDQVVAFDSDDPTSACYAQFTPSGSGSTAHVPMKPGPGGEIRPGWFTNLAAYDLLDNKTEEDIDATGSTPASLVTRFEYDPNQNLIKVTKPEGNTVEYDYEERNLRIAVRVGNAPDTPATTITAYDGNGNAFQVIGPAQRGGPGNHQTATIEDAFRSATTLVHTGDFVLEYVYDGFDRVTRAIDAVGNTAEMKHDPDSRVVEHTPRGPIGGPTPTNRNGTSNIDLARMVVRFDEASRDYEKQRDVFLGSGTTLPSLRAVTHTGGGLEANSTANGHTGTVTLTSGGTSYVLVRVVHDRAGRVIDVVEDNVGRTTSAYDGANRKVRETDALQAIGRQNVVELEHDNNGNITRTTRIERCTITQPTVADEVFRSVMRYDSLSRPVVQAEQGADGTLDDRSLACTNDANWQVDPSALLTRLGYDSRGNQTLSIDPKGNTLELVYDGANRCRQSLEHLRTGGQGNAPPSPGQSFLLGGGASIATTMVVDPNGRVTRVVDDRGGVTDYKYDSLDRQIALIYDDGSTRTSVYNPASDVTTLTDENGSVLSNTFDAMGRKTAVAITLAAGVVGTTAQSFEFDGLSRQTFSRDSVGATNCDVRVFYDSLSRTLEDSQAFAAAVRNATNTKFVSHAVTQFTFPNGRQTNNAYDLLYRRTLVEEAASGADISTWQFFGGRVAEAVRGNGLICTYMNNTRTRSAVQAGQPAPRWGNQSSERLGYDGAGRPITKRFLAGGINGTTFAYNNTSAIVGFTTEYDRSSNKFFERHLHAESRSHLYEPFGAGAALGCYDSLDRLRQYQRGVLSSTGGFGNRGGGSITTPISLPNANESQTYDLDGLGNWRKTAIDPVGAVPFTQVRQHNPLNQTTRTTAGSTSTDFAYDGVVGASNGNLADDGLRLYTWDALNRLKEVRRKSDSALIGEYTYDAMGRRARKVVSNGGMSGSIPNGTMDVLWLGWQSVEERDGSNAPTKQYVWGIYIDELVEQTILVAINAFSAGAVLYPLQDLLYRTTALSDSVGVIREAYDTDAYGNTLIFRNSGTPPGAITWTNGDAQAAFPTCDVIFTGQRWDAETGLHFYRNRYLHPALGRFLSRDPVANVNEYPYVDDRPTSFVDPLGWAAETPSDRLRSVVDCPECCEVRVYASWAVTNVAYHLCIEVENTFIEGNKSVCRTTAIELMGSSRDAEFAKLPKGSEPLKKHLLGRGPVVLGNVTSDYANTLIQNIFGGNPDEAWGMWLVTNYDCSHKGARPLQDAGRLQPRPGTDACAFANCIYETAQMVGNAASGIQSYRPLQRNSNSFIGTIITTCFGEFPAGNETMLAMAPAYDRSWIPPPPPPPRRPRFPLLNRMIFGQ